MEKKNLEYYMNLKYPVIMFFLVCIGGSFALIALRHCSRNNLEVAL